MFSPSFQVLASEARRSLTALSPTLHVVASEARRSLAALPPTLQVLGSEAILALYPVLLRTLPTNLFTQWFARFLTFPVLATVAEPKPFKWSATTLLAGLINLLHIGASYVSFTLLPAGIALSVFYLYPIFNVLAGALFLGDRLTPIVLLLVLLAAAGVYLLATSEQESSEASEALKDAKEPSATQEPSATSEPSATRNGIIAGVIAAFTETLLYLYVRIDPAAAASPFHTIQQLYPVGLVVLSLALAAQPTLLDLRPQTLLPLFAFNALIGFTGYAVRFHAIPHVSTLVFSILSFVGVVFGYLWSHWLTKDETHPRAWLGSALIVIAAVLASQ